MFHVCRFKCNVWSTSLSLAKKNPQAESSFFWPISTKTGIDANGFDIPKHTKLVYPIKMLSLVKI